MLPGMMLPSMMGDMLPGMMLPSMMGGMPPGEMPDTNSEQMHEPTEASHLTHTWPPGVIGGLVLRAMIAATISYPLLTNAAVATSSLTPA